MQDRSSSILTKVFVSATTAPTIFLHHPYIHIGSLPSLIPLAHNHYLAHARIPSVQSLSQELTRRAQSFSHLAVAALHAYILTPRSRSPLAMLPAQRNKVDISSLNEEEQKLFRLYGKLPKKDLLQNRLKERKYFDSGDYALSKAGKAPQQSVGTAIPNPEMIPHASTVTSPGANAVSPPGSLPGQQAGGLAGPVNVPGAERLASRPQVSAFPISGAGSSPGKESSSLGREEHVVNADDAMQD